MERPFGASVKTLRRLIDQAKGDDARLGFQPGILDAPAAAGMAVGAITLLGGGTVLLHALMIEPTPERTGYQIVAALGMLLGVLLIVGRARVSRPVRHGALVLAGALILACIALAVDAPTALVFAQCGSMLVIAAYALVPVQQSVWYLPLTICAVFLVLATTQSDLTPPVLIVSLVITVVSAALLHWRALGALRSETDPLTAIGNHSGFRRRLTAHLRHSPQTVTTVVFLDLDHFALTNDRCPIDGDQVLIDFAIRVSRGPGSEAAVCRTGGDEFALMLPGTTAAEAVSLVEQLRPDVHAFSAGIVVSEAGASVSEIMTHPADALSAAKRGGRGVSRQHSGHYAGIAAIRRAVDDGEFFLEYQPIVDLHTRGIIGAEALVRWQHPTRGRIAPDEFIGHCEASGSIVLLGEWVMGEALRTAASWNIPAVTGYPPFVMSVNVSGVEFADPSYVARALAVASAPGLSAGAFALKLTETAYGLEADVVARNMALLHEGGIRVAIDDFGTCFSNLERLSTLSTSVLKIDRRFVSEIESAADDAPLLQTILSLAQAITNGVVAEGVETEVQAVWLLEHGCHVAQGYLFSRPVRADAFEALCR